MEAFGNIRVLDSHSGRYLVDSIATSGPAKLITVPVKSKKFANGEIKVELELEGSVRDKATYVVATGTNERPEAHIGEDGKIVVSNSWTVNDHVAELELILDTVKRSDSGKITVIIPFCPYLRQDRRMTREPIAAAVICHKLEHGANRLITFDAHFEQFQGMFDGTYVINVNAKNMLCRAILKEFGTPSTAGSVEGSLVMDPTKYVVVSPDEGGSKRAEKTAATLRLSCGTMMKERDYSKMNTVVGTKLLWDGEPAGREALLIDDMVDTGGTIVSAARTLVRAGFSKVHIVATHGIFSDAAISLFNESSFIGKIFVTDSLPQTTHQEALGSKLCVVHIGPFLTKLIYVIESGGSVTKFLTEE